MKTTNTVFNLLSLALFVIGSLASRIPGNQNLDVEERKIDKIGPFRLHSKKWAVLVAGSSGWENYRHQADVFHAYQILKANGIPKENIITMAVNDTVFHQENPVPGKIFNKPNGPDVYDGVVIDYKGDDVSSKNFLNVITGNEEAMRSIGSGKVIKGGPFDKIFINFVDHGSVGLLSFPQDVLYADELNDALNKMRSKNSYGKMLLYIEACHSGSMFDGILRDDTNILAVTAAGPYEPSYAAYCYSDGTCLGDLFSVMWMEEVEKATSDFVAKRKTVFNNFSNVRTNVPLSNVMMYGDFDVGREKLSTFIGNRPRGGNSSTKHALPFIKPQNVMISCGHNVHGDTKKHHSMEENLTYLQRQVLEEETSETDKKRNIIDTVFRIIYMGIKKFRPDIENEAGTLYEPTNLSLSLDMFPCYRNIVTKITENCFSVNNDPYVLNQLTLFANLCVIDQNIYEEVNEIIDDTCSKIPKDTQKTKSTLRSVS